MVSTLQSIQDEIFAYADSIMPQRLVEKSWRDAESVKLVNGMVPYYLSVEFGDLQPGKQSSMVGVMGDNHTIPISFFAMGPDMKGVRRIANTLTMGMLSFKTRYSGELKKRAGGQLMPLVASNGALEGYSQLIMFDISIQLAEV